MPYISEYKTKYVNLLKDSYTAKEVRDIINEIIQYMFKHKGKVEILINYKIRERKCKKPKKRIYSLESLGVNVIKLVKKYFDFDLEWNDNEYIADFVSAVWAVFYKEDVP